MSASPSTLKAQSTQAATTRRPPLQLLLAMMVVVLNVNVFTASGATITVSPEDSIQVQPVDFVHALCYDTVGEVWVKREGIERSMYLYR